jgi:hypothetical protein
VSQTASSPAIEIGRAAPLSEVRPTWAPRWCWIASYPKSGNTWLRLFVSAYFFGDGEVGINAPAGALAGDLNENAYRAVTAGELETLDPYTCFVVRPAALHWLAEKLGGDAFVKTHCARARVAGNDLIPEHMTRGALYVVRDPRDVAASFAEHNGTSIDLAIARMADRHSFLETKQMYHFLDGWSDHVRSWTAPAPFEVEVLRYEDICADPLAAFAQVVRFLTGGKEPDTELLARSVEAVSLAGLKGQEAAAPKGFREARPGRSFFGGQREAPTDLQRARIERDHGEVMARFDYL